MLFFWTSDSSKNSQKYESPEEFSKLIIIRNVFWASNQHISMISEGSCDTEDWRDDAHHRNIFKQITAISIVKIFHNITILKHFWLNKFSLEEHLFI